jgi:intracellular multiplication protein IcmX
MKMTKYINKKTTMISTIALMGALSSAFAGSNPLTPPANNSGVVTAINKLSDKVEAIAKAKAKTNSQLLYQIDQYLPNIMAPNTAILSYDNQMFSPDQYTRQVTNNTVQDHINNTLSQVAYAVTPPPAGSQAAQDLQNYQNANSLTRLTTGTKANDTLYYNNSSGLDSYAAEILGVSKPDASELHNNYFNFASLFTPMNYSTDQATAANNFIKYATLDFQPVTTGINFQKLRNATPQELKNFMTSPAFQNYQLNVRSTLASRSVLLNNLEHMIAERSTIQNLGKEAGLKDSNGKSITDASPLQVQQYVATHRVHSKQWYQNMANASPATVQRETLYVLAEIEAQNFQRHMDNERLLAAISSLQIQTQKTVAMMMKAKNQNINQAIDDVMQGKKPSSVTDEQNNNYNNSDAEKKYQQEAKKQQQKKNK